MPRRQLSLKISKQSKMPSSRGPETLESHTRGSHWPLPLTSWVTLGKLWNIPGPLFLHPRNGPNDNMIPVPSYQGSQLLTRFQRPKGMYNALRTEPCEAISTRELLLFLFVPDVALRSPGDRSRPNSCPSLPPLVESRLSHVRFA